ncbi:nitroreductase family protein [Corticibacter populi]|uniref:Nitroreductase family protein n=1 Tax=Corticibacter populi TaxID=1550736 RepID=A0A3M6QKF1_9BURK|nr:nitroreductase family protein [Corticibacter populi]RMX03570.1 nitroreductase family protein [Corticibacter populi]RZS30021.1 nitroreductase [Corticibacter populi]
MNTSIRSTIETRTSVNDFQPNLPLDDGAIAKLVDLATRAPSAYNLQNWRFIAVRSQDAKVRLKAAAFGQQKVVDASVTFIICGTLAAHRQLRAALQPSVEAHVMAQRVVDAWVAQASASHENDAVLQRDEAVRSASLAAMTLMLAAQGMGLGSCAMGGFDAAQVAQAFGLGPSELPVVIVAIGHPATGNWPQKPRKPLPEILAIV